MKRIGIIAYSGLAEAFSAAALKALLAKGVDIATLSAKELEEQAIAADPASFPVFIGDASTAYERRRFAGYMKRARRKRY